MGHQYSLTIVSSQQISDQTTNRSNFHNHCPYIYNEQKQYYIIDKQWYQNLNPKTQTELKNKFNVGQIVKISNPHQVKGANKYWQIYNWYNCSVYDFSRYVQDINRINGQFIHIVKFVDDEEKKQFGKLFFKQKPQIQKMQRLNKQINKILQEKPETGFFIKSTQRSSKNQKKIFPARTLQDVYKNLIYSPDIQKQLNESSGIVMRKWINFQNSLQFRVHIYKHRILAISPQYYEVSLKDKYKNINFNRLVKLLKQGIAKVTFQNSFVLDVMFVNNEKVWFLQFNPYGVYSASGLAIFTRQEILQLEGKVAPIAIKLLGK